MKKRFFAVLLALVMCLGPAAPAFAAERETPPLPTVALELPDGSAAREETAEYQLRQFAVETKEEPREGYVHTYDIYTYNEGTTTEAFAVTPLPMGAVIRIDGTSPGNSDWFHLTLRAWSDPDGDGVYEARIFRWEPNPAYSHTSYDLMPLGAGPYDESSEDAWDGFVTTVEAEYSGFPTDVFGHSALLATSDGLYERFGPNTLIQLDAEYVSQEYTGEPETLACFLLNGGESREPAAAVSGPGSELPREDREFTLRNFTVKNEIDGERYSSIRDVFTRSTEPETVGAKDVATLTLGSKITVSGLRPYNYDGERWDIVSLCAWSDPDGDGVYDQRLLTHTSKKDNFAALPISEAGPINCFLIDVDDYYRPVYRLDANVWGADALTRQWHNYQEVAFPSSVSLSAELLTRLFGPNTLIRLDVKEPGTHAGDPPEPVSFYCFVPEGQTVPPAFSDVPDWCADAAEWAAYEKIANGTGSGRFSPDKLCTNAMILTFLWRAEGEPESGVQAPIPLTGNEYYAGAVRWAAEKGMIDGSFDPDAYCTRATAVNYIWQASFYMLAGSPDHFTDVPAGADYADAVDWAAAYGVANGTGDGLFSPDKVCTRGEIVTFLRRAYFPAFRFRF